MSCSIGSGVLSGLVDTLTCNAPRGRYSVRETEAQAENRVALATRPNQYSRKPFFCACGLGMCVPVLNPGRMP